MMNSPQYIPGLQMLSPCRSQQGIVIIWLQTSGDLERLSPFLKLLMTPEAKDWALRYVLSVLFVIEGSDVMVILQLIDKCWF